MLDWINQHSIVSISEVLSDTNLTAYAEAFKTHKVTSKALVESDEKVFSSFILPNSVESQNFRPATKNLRSLTLSSKKSGWRKRDTFPDSGRLIENQTNKNNFFWEKSTILFGSRQAFPAFTEKRKETTTSFERGVLSAHRFTSKTISKFWLFLVFYSTHPGFWENWWILHYYCLWSRHTGGTHTAKSKFRATWVKRVNAKRLVWPNLFDTELFATDKRRI